MTIQIIADSSCDITPSIREKLHLVSVPLKIQVAGGKAYVDDGSIDIPELIAGMKASKQATATACPSPEDYASLMRQYDACFVITLSSKLSGSNNAARVARDMVMETHPEKKICVLDSKSASAGEVRLALFLHECIEAGEDFDGIVKKAEAFIANQRTLFVLEDLGNFVKNGRLNKVTGIVASILALCPIMSDDGEGEVKMASKVRGIQNALHKLVDTVAEQTAERARQSVTMVLAYCNCPERAAAIKEEFFAKCAALRDIIMVPTGGLSTVYANQGGIVVAF